MFNATMQDLGVPVEQLIPICCIDKVSAYAGEFAGNNYIIMEYGNLAFGSYTPVIDAAIKKATEMRQATGKPSRFVSVIVLESNQPSGNVLSSLYTSITALNSQITAGTIDAKLVLLNFTSQDFVKRLAEKAKNLLLKNAEIVWARNWNDVLAAYQAN
jgi:hypothetical protein